MSQEAGTLTRKGGVDERPNHVDDKSNPFTPSVTADASESRRERTPSTLRAEQHRRALLALRARVYGNVTQTADTALSGYGVEATRASLDTADRATEIAEQDLALSLLGSVAGTLEQIEAALQRIEDGSYGRCVKCEARIPVARLEAIPYTPCCVKCAARQDRVA